MRIRCDVERILVDATAGSTGVDVNGRTIGARAVVSNANLKSTIFNLVGEEHFDRKFVDEARGRAAEQLELPGLHGAQAGRSSWTKACGDLLFSSTAPLFRTELLLSRDITSRTYSFYYPRTRPGSNRSLIVSSTNANYQRLGRPVARGLRGQQARSGRDDDRRRWRNTFPISATKLDHAEASTPLTFAHYTQHLEGASFGTKFEGLAVSRGTARAGGRAVPRRQRRHHHVGLAGRDELRRDRGQRRSSGEAPMTRVR